MLPVTEPSKEGDDSPSIEADPRVEPESPEESKEDMKVETEYKVEEEPEVGIALKYSVCILTISLVRGCRNLRAC